MDDDRIAAFLQAARAGMDAASTMDHRTPAGAVSVPPSSGAEPSAVTTVKTGEKETESDDTDDEAADSNHVDTTASDTSAVQSSTALSKDQHRSERGRSEIPAKEQQRDQSMSDRMPSTASSSRSSRSSSSPRMPKPPTLPKVSSVQQKWLAQRTHAQTAAGKLVSATETAPVSSSQPRRPATSTSADLPEPATRKPEPSQESTAAPASSSSPAAPMAAFMQAPVSPGNHPMLRGSREDVFPPTAESRSQAVSKPVPAVLTESPAVEASRKPTPPPVTAKPAAQSPPVWMQSPQAVSQPVMAKSPVTASQSVMNTCFTAIGNDDIDDTRRGSENSESHGRSIAQAADMSEDDVEHDAPLQRAPESDHSNQSNQSKTKDKAKKPHRKLKKKLSKAQMHAFVIRQNNAERRRQLRLHRLREQAIAEVIGEVPRQLSLAHVHDHRGGRHASDARLDDGARSWSRRRGLKQHEAAAAARMSSRQHRALEEVLGVPAGIASQRAASTPTSQGRRSGSARASRHRKVSPAQADAFYRRNREWRARHDATARVARQHAEREQLEQCIWFSSSLGEAQEAKGVSAGGGLDHAGLDGGAAGIGSSRLTSSGMILRNQSSGGSKKDIASISPPWRSPTARDLPATADAAVMRTVASGSVSVSTFDHARGSHSSNTRLSQPQPRRRVRVGDTSFFDRTVRWQKARKEALKREAEKRLAEQEASELSECTFQPLSRAQIQRRWDAKHARSQPRSDADGKKSSSSSKVVVRALEPSVVALIQDGVGTDTIPDGGNTAPTTSALTSPPSRARKGLSSPPSSKRGPDVRPLSQRSRPSTSKKSGSKSEPAGRLGHKASGRDGSVRTPATESALMVRPEAVAPASAMSVRLSLHAWDAATGNDESGSSVSHAEEAVVSMIPTEASAVVGSLQDASEAQSALTQDEFTRRLQALEERSARSRMALAAALAEESRAGTVESQARTGVQLD